MPFAPGDAPVTTNFPLRAALSLGLDVGQHADAPNVHTFVHTFGLAGAPVTTPGEGLPRDGVLQGSAPACKKQFLKTRDLLGRFSKSEKLR